MALKKKVGQTETSIQQIKLDIKGTKTKVEHLYSKVNTLSQDLRTIFKIWNGFFKTLGIIVGIVLAGLITWLTHGLYITNGKWGFGTIMLGGFIYLVVLAVVIVFVWMITDNFLVGQIRED
jgi:hypothetical protein